MCETSHYMNQRRNVPRNFEDMGQDYRFSAANDESLETKNHYEDIPDPDPMPDTNPHAEPAPSPFLTQSIEPREDNFKFRWILIMVAVAFFINLGVSAFGLWMAIQGNSRITQVQDNMTDKLNAEVVKRKTAVDAINNSITVQSIRIKDQHDTLNHRQDNLTETMNLTFFDFLGKLDSLSQKHELQVIRQNQTDKFVNSTLLNFYQTFSLTNGIRLVNGNSLAGRVEIYHNGVWGTICDDVIDYEAGNLMCRLLGFNGATAMYSSARYGPGSGPTWLDDLRCSGTETTLGDCSHRGWGVENCSHNEDLSITCS